jgi:hypothetical protein
VHSWVDTCCIDKSSSAELQEAITSMFDWYRNAVRCYVYLSDVTATQVDPTYDSLLWKSAFRKSRWFTRGWILQELLAPALVEFFSLEGKRLGDKKSLEALIHDITGIPHRALQGDSMSNFSVAERLSWAEYRQTQRKEDRAYCLLGLFSVFMLLIYGEGNNTFIQLQEKIRQKHADIAKQDELPSKLPAIRQAAFNSFENQYESTCLPDTRVELLREITEWVNGPDRSRIYWLNGIAGTGKSTVARTIARTFHDRGILGASFLFSRGGRDISRASKLFTTIAWQLAITVPQVRAYIGGAIMEQENIADQSLRDQWDNLIIKPLSKLRSNTPVQIVLIVLDALDECDSEQDIRIILRLLASTKLLKNICLRIFITSRPEISIRCGFYRMALVEQQIFVLHDILPDIVNHDLGLFFENNFAAIREEHSLEKTWPGNRIIKHLVEISGSFFIWAATACRFIREGRRLAMKRVANLLAGRHSSISPEKKLDEIYTSVLNAVVPEDYSDKEKKEACAMLREVLGSIAILFS